MALTEYQILRVDVGLAADDIASLPDDQAQANMDRSALLYPDPANPAGAQYAHTRVVTLEQLYARAVTMNDYTQNNSQEKSSQTFDHYKALLDLWNGKLGNAVMGGGTGGGTALFEVINRSGVR